MKFHKIIFFIGFIALVFFLFSSGEQTATLNPSIVCETAPTQNDSLEIGVITIAGDAMAHKPQTDAAFLSNENRHDFGRVCEFIRPVLENSDLNILNLETTLAGEPYKGYPQFSAPDAFAEAFKKAGFHFFVLANNHCADRGNAGAKRTLNILKQMNIPSAGVYLDSMDRSQRYPALLYARNIKIALLNYTYGTNGLILHNPLSVNYLSDTLQIVKDIEKAKKLKPDVILALLHWGNEYERQPSKTQKQQARFFLSHGVDAIVGSHPHVVQPFEYFAYDETDSTKKKPVFWSLGNLVSNQRNEHTDGGILAQLFLSKNQHTGEVKIQHCQGIPYWVYKNTDIHPGYFILPTYRFFDQSYSFPFTTQDSAAYLQFCFNTDALFPIRNGKKTPTLP